MLGQGNWDLFGHSVLEQKRALPVVERDAGHSAAPTLLQP